MRPSWNRTGLVFGALVVAAALASPAAAQSAGSKQGVPAAPSAGAGAASPGGKTPADIFKDAREAYKKGDYETALKGFQAVWAVEKKAKVAGNLGRTELKLKHYRDAAEHLELFLRMETGMEPDERTAVFAELNQAKAHVTTLRIVATPDAAEVYVDGASVGTAPLDHDLFVEAGHHKIEARMKGMTDVKEIDTKEGSEWPVKLQVPEKKEGPPPPVVEPPKPFPTRIVILTAGGGVALIGGVLMGVAAGQKSSVLAEVPKDASGGPLCSKTAGQDRGSAAECDTIRSKTGAIDTTWGVGVGFLVVGGVAAAATAATLLLPSSGKSANKATSQVLPVVGADGAGVLWQGSF